MSSPELVIDEAERVYKWRLMWLERYYSLHNAEMLANDLSIDLHSAIWLGEKCKDEDLRMRIIYGS